MAPTLYSSPAAAPAAHITPAVAPATSTPSPKDPPGSLLSSSASPVGLGNPGSGPDPRSSPGSGDQQIEQKFNSQSNSPPTYNTIKLSSNGPKVPDQLSNNGNSNNDGPSKNQPGSSNSPANNNVPSNDPSKEDSSENNPPSGPPSHHQPSSNGQSSNNDPPDKDWPSSNTPSHPDSPIDNKTPGKGSSSVVAAASSQPSAQLRDPPGHGAPTEDPSKADTVQTPGLGILIMNAFNNAPSSIPSPFQPPDMPHSELKAIETAIHGSPSPVTVDANPIQKVSDAAVLGAGSETQSAIGDQALNPGGAATKASGIATSLPTAQTPTFNIPATTIEASLIQEGRPPLVTVGNKVFTPNPSAFATAGTTISAGGSGVFVAGPLISLQPSDLGWVVKTPSDSPTPSAITIGTNLLTPNPSGLSIDGTYISAGAPAVTIAGTAFSLQSANGGLVVGSSTLALPFQVPTPSAVTIGTEVFTPDLSGFSIDGTFISAGAPAITIAGTAISLLPAGNGMVVGSSTLALPSHVHMPSAITVGNLTFTPHPAETLLAGTRKWAGGPDVTVDGTMDSLEPSDGGLVLGNSKFWSVFATPTSAAGLPGITGSGAGSTSVALSGGSNAASTRAMQFTSSGGHKCLELRLAAGFVFASALISI